LWGFDGENPTRKKGNCNHRKKQIPIPGVPQMKTSKLLVLLVSVGFGLSSIPGSARCDVGSEKRIVF